LIFGVYPACSYDKGNRNPSCKKPPLGDIERNSATIPLHVSNDEVAASDAVSLHPDKNYKYKNKKNENNNQQIINDVIGGSSSLVRLYQRR
jgi:hypothetical protein